MERSFRHFFDQDPYAFQLETASHLLAGRNVVLQAPTGAGKTFGALFPFFHAKQQGLAFADRLIYALPQRTLTVALFDKAREYMPKLPGLRIAIQTGVMPFDSLFESDVVFTTIDQLLSAYIGVPVSLPRKRANLPAGAILGSYVVFDEFHLLEPGRAMATALDLADRLRRYTRLLLMSATVPEQTLRIIARRSHAEVVQVTADQVAEIPSQQGKERRFIRRNQPLTAADILDAPAKKSIAVVNRVERAQEVFEEIRRLVERRGVETQVLLIHSRFLRDDRQKIESMILNHFKEGATGAAILIATQVIEVGLDISCEVMHTELAPANSIFQRAGRCARYGGEKGTVYVYDLPLNERGTSIYGPYLKVEQALVDETGRQIAARSGNHIGFEQERAIVDAVHTQADQDLLNAVHPEQRRIEVATAMRTGDAEHFRDLIRFVDSVHIIVHDHPERLQLNRRPESFSINRDVVKGFLRSLALEGADRGSIQIPEFDKEGQDESPGVTWHELTSPQQAVGAIYIAIAPTHAHYDPQLGLRLEQGSSRSSFWSHETLPHGDAAFDLYSYVKETYKEHVELVTHQHDLQASSCRVASLRLAETFGVSPETIESLSRLVAGLHDVGKLADGWQNAIWKWQQEIHREVRPPGCFLAHSQFDSSDPFQREQQRNKQYKKPPHAVEGAYAASPALLHAVKKEAVPREQVSLIVRSLASAIARHHSAFSEQMENFSLSKEAHVEAVQVAGLDSESPQMPDRPSPSHRDLFRKSLITPDQADAFLLYWYVARRLRLADQQATSMAGAVS